MKMSRLIWMMAFAVVLGFSVTEVVAAQNAPPKGDPPKEDPPGGHSLKKCIGCVTTVNLADNAVTGAKVLDGSLTGADIQDGSIGVSKLVPGSVVTAVTATAPLVSSGGATPVISLPGVTISSSNTAIGGGALFSNATGNFNTASGVSALSGNTTGSLNTASGASALFRNTTGNFNTASGVSALFRNTTGGPNTASGVQALFSNTTGNLNTAIGASALSGNTTGSLNTAIGFGADVSTDGLINATAIGSGALVNASNKIRLGNSSVTVIEGQVGFTASSDATKKENFQPVDAQAVLDKIRGLNLKSWNFIGQDPKQFRHYGPTAQEFFAAFGSDGLGTIGTPTTITSTDIEGILMIAVQALENRTSQQREEVENLKAENATLKARLEAIEKTLTK